MTNMFMNRDGSSEPRTMIYPINPGTYFQNPRNTTVSQPESGLFTRLEIDDAFLDSVGQRALNNPSAMTIEDLQLWGQHSWKAEHGTIHAADRFGEKLVEESIEFDEALLGFMNNPTIENRDHAVSEAGDVLWSLTAGASNAGISIEQEIQRRVLASAVGMIIHTSEGPQPPSWRNKAIEIGTSNIKPVTINDIDELFSLGFVPEFATAMNLDLDHFDPELAEEVYTEWSINIAIAHVLSHEFGVELAGNIHQPYEKLREDIAQKVAFMYLRTVYTLRVITGVSLAETWPVNFSKVNGRVAAGLIDRTDGERPDELL